MLLLDKKDLLLLTLLKLCMNKVLLNIQLLLPPLLLKLLLFNFWLLILPVPLENISEIMENTLSSFMTIFLNKPSPIDKCLFFLEDPLEEKLTLEMSFIFTLVFWREPPKWEKNSVLDLWLLYPLLKPKPEMCLPIFPPTLFPLPMDKFSWKLNYFTKVSDLPSTSVCLCQESDLPLKLLPWNKLPVNLS